MSGGEQQMLTIGRTLMGNPLLLMLDEPSEGLAPRIVEQMAKAILDLKREGLSLLVSEQNLHFAQMIADDAVILERGAVRYDGTLRGSRGASRRARRLSGGMTPLWKTGRPAKEDLSWPMTRPPPAAQARPSSATSAS